MSFLLILHNNNNNNNNNNVIFINITQLGFFFFLEKHTKLGLISIQIKICHFPYNPEMTLTTVLVKWVII